MLSILISIFAILVTIFFVVGIHELGHFLVARWMGVKVLLFSIGFGKALYRWHDRKGTEYVLAAIPLGGYVKMLDEHEENVPEEEQRFAYNVQPFYKKFAIVIAGPLANILFAFLIYWSIFMIGFVGLIPAIGQITPHSIAAKAGMKPNQEIVQVDQEPTESWMGVLINLLIRMGDRDTLSIVTRDLDTQQKQTFNLPLADWHVDELKPDPLTTLGIQPWEPEIPPNGVDRKITVPAKLLRNHKYGPIEALQHAWLDTKVFIKMNLIVIGKLLTGKMSLASLGGPVSIFQTAGATLNQGLVPFLSFLAFLSIAIGLVNILPIPGLDGGHLVFQTIEAIIRQPIPLNIQLLAYRFGLILLFLLLTQAIVNDILRF